MNFHPISSVNWSQRLTNHCRYYAIEKLPGIEIYDIWLRVSAGPAGDPFEEFLCQGEGAYASCLKKVKQPKH
jgi:hypothetical protein